MRLLTENAVNTDSSDGGAAVGGDFSAHAGRETLLRAWKAYDRFEGKSSMRIWLHRIATNTCLSVLEGRQRRPLPTGLGAPSSDPTAELIEHGRGGLAVGDHRDQPAFLDGTLLHKFGLPDSL